MILVKLLAREARAGSVKTARLQRKRVFIFGICRVYGAKRGSGSRIQQEAMQTATTHE